MTNYQWLSASSTKVGKVRKLNEDACLALPEIGLWVVADGMGGHNAGDLASQTIISHLQAINPPRLLSEFVDEVEDAILGVNDFLIEEAQRRGGQDMIGSTVVALLAYQEYVICLWAGDSRLYLLRDRSFSRVTRDHSQVEELIQMGKLSLDEAESHPSANVVTRAVGGQEELCLQVELRAVKENDIFLLCSDGLYKELSEKEIGEIIMQYQNDVEECIAQLMQAAYQRQARDNITIIIAKAKQLELT